MESMEPDKCPIRFPLKNSVENQESKVNFSMEQTENSGDSQAKSTIPSIEELVENAEVLVRARDFDLAKNLVGRSLQFYPRNRQLLNLLAEISVILRDWEMVEKSYRALVDVDDSEESVLKLCETLQRTGHYSEQSSPL